MARIPDDEIQRLKKEISLEHLATARGIKLARTGANLLGLCPFHADREPSLVITPETNLWHCLGACQAGGSVIDWVMKAEGVSFRHAVELLRRDAVPAVASKAGAPPKRTTTRHLSPLASPDADDAALLGSVADHYHAALPEDADAQGYLRLRGLEHPEVAAHFRLGFVNRTLGYQLPANYLKAGQALRGRLTELGVLRTTGHEHLRGSLVVPLFDAEGRVVQLYGRKIDDRHQPHHLYLPGPLRGVFNRGGIEGQEEVILCEALIDALTFWCAGYRKVTSGYGIEGVTDELLDALEASRVRVVKIAFDRDEAGDRGAEKVSERLFARGIASARVLFPKGMDANAYARKLTPAAKSLELVLSQAEWMRGEKTTSPVASTLIPSLAASPPPSAAPPLEAAAPVVEEPAAQPDEPPAPAAAATPQMERDGDDLFFVFLDRKWRARPASRATASELRFNVLVSDEREGGGFFVDTVDLYSARQRAHFTKHAAEELAQDESELRRELGAIVLELESQQKSREAAAGAAASVPPAGDAMSDADRDEALALLRDPRLCERIVEDLGRAGMVGEETNKLICYLGATSRKLEEPLAIVIQSSSAAGKSSLMEAVLGLMPSEERVQYSAMTGQSLFYMSGQSLKHKILAIVEEEGAERASYALKLLQSEGELSIASTGKDPATGRLVTQTYRVEGPVMIFLTTTSPDVDEELLNRCMVLSVDERRGQTRAIHEKQRESQTLEGVLARADRQRIRRLHRNAQRLLEPLLVVNPFARELEFADHATRARRDHMKYLTMIRAVTLLFQHQRPRKTTVHRGETLTYIEATREDVELATRLAEAVLPRSLDDLPPQTRRLLDLVAELVRARMDRERVAQVDVRFTRREVREWTRWGQTQLRLHLERLEEHEYVIVHRVGRGSRLQIYELAEPAAVAASLVSGHDGRASSGIEGSSSGVHRGIVAPLSGGHRGPLAATNSGQLAANVRPTLNGAKHA